MPNSKRLFCFGLGFSSLAVARRMLDRGWEVAGTCRTPEKQTLLWRYGIEAHLFNDEQDIKMPSAALAGATHIIDSIPPGRDTCPTLTRHGPDIMRLESLQWAGYLSTTGVYGNTDGAEVDETAPLRPSGRRGQARVEAEDHWYALGLPVHVFRLAGIYGPGRSTFDQIRAGRARRIDKPGHCFSRIHVEDIAATLTASIDRPNPAAAYNVCDDKPAPPAEVTAYACELMGIDPPPLIPFEEARAGMSDMALSFWNDNRRVSNRRIRTELAVELAYPTYREGLRSVYEDDF
ncbi:SDR family NAD(P)-dependent oxidoreductase [Alphaproteobacteria bacterium HT1-32]|nr:SDR family NAD(P)-dependent oxidoreductase [Alphaproteobacteria bacterium HT1-32]